jgi:hypothetical protein
MYVNLEKLAALRYCYDLGGVCDGYNSFYSGEQKVDLLLRDKLGITADTRLVKAYCNILVLLMLVITPI